MTSRRTRKKKVIKGSNSRRFTNSSKPTTEKERIEREIWRHRHTHKRRTQYVDRKKKEDFNSVLQWHSIDKNVESILDLNMNEMKTYIENTMKYKIPETNELNTILLFKILEQNNLLLVSKHPPPPS